MVRITLVCPSIIKNLPVEQLHFCLAPADCLQYFTGTSGQVSTFNWKDDTSATRQLNGQVYNICFRTEQLSSGQVVGRMMIIIPNVDAIN